MRAIDVMTRPVLTVRTDDSIEQAAALLGSHRITAAPVVDPDGGLLGIVSEGDLLRARTSAEPGRPHAAVVGDVMTRAVVKLPPETDLSAVAEAMLRHNVHSVPIVDDQEQLEGIVCRHDVLRASVRSDDVVQLDVQCRLDEYAGGERVWTATVTDGVVEVGGAYSDEVEHNVVEVLVRTVPGVTAVRRRP